MFSTMAPIKLMKYNNGQYIDHETGKRFLTIQRPTPIVIRGEETLYLEYARQIPSDVFTNVVAKYLPIETLRELGKTNRDLRDTYLTFAKLQKDAWKIAFKTEDVELLNLIQDQPPEDPTSMYWSAMNIGPEFLYAVLKHYTAEQIEDLVHEIYRRDWDCATLGRYMITKPEIIDIFLQDIDHLVGIVDSTFNSELFELIRQKAGYIPRELFNFYIGCITSDAIDDCHANTGSSMVAMLIDPNSRLNVAMKLLPYVK